MYMRHIFYVNLNCFYSLRSDVRTDSLVDMIKKQQAKTNELGQIYREQQEHND